MKRYIFCPLVIFFLTNMKIVSQDTHIINFSGHNYIEVFSDDFNGVNLDSSKWERCPEWKRADLGGYWKNECSYVKDGCLILEAKKDKNQLSSGAIRSKDRFEQSYGLYKIRFLAEKTSACWFAFWLFNKSQYNIGNGATDGAEIDIFEIVPNHIKKKEHKQFINSAVHWDGYGKNLHSAGSKFPIDDSFFDQWHEVTFEWTPEYYKAYLDNSEVPYWSTEGESERYGGINTKPNYLKLTVEIGTWAGPLIEELLPAHFYVDWIKVYKEQD